MDIKTLWTKKNLLVLFSALILASLTYLHISLVLKTFVIDADGNYHTAIAGYGDIPLHLTQISKFAYDTLDNLEEPIYLGEKIKYPFGINLISGLILRSGGSMLFSVLGPIIFLVLANILLAFFVYGKIVRNRLLCALAVVVFFLGSGFGGYQFIERAIDTNQSLTVFADDLTENSRSTINRLDAKYPDQNIAYGAPLSLVFLHQRPFFLGLFGVLLLGTSLYYLRRSNMLGLMILGAVAYGLLPLAHTHSFVAASVLIFSTWIIARILGEHPFAKRVLYLAIIGFAIAVPQLLYLLSSKDILSDSGGFAVIRLGWMVAPTIGSLRLPDNPSIVVTMLAYIKFLLVNIGVLLPVFIVGSVVIFFSKRFRKVINDYDGKLWLLVFALTATLLFIILQTVRFQPWDYDNNKILVYWQLFAAPVVLYLFGKLIKRKMIVGVATLVIFLIFSLFSGVIDQIPRMKVARERTPVIFGTDSQELAKFIRQNIQKDRAILTGSSHLNPVSSLVGRSVLEGYPGWLWTRGIDYSTRDGQIRNFYSKPNKNATILKEFGIGYILVDGQVTYDFNTDMVSLNRLFKKVFQAGQYSLYQI